MASFNIGDSRVIESREVSDGVAIRRRRETPDGRRFTTYERVEKPNLIVTKKNGSRELFDRVKLAHAVHSGRTYSLNRMKHSRKLGYFFYIFRFDISCSPGSSHIIFPVVSKDDARHGFFIQV